LIEETIKTLEEVFKIKLQGSLDKYLGCKIIMTHEGFKIGQEKIIDNLITKFKDYMSGREFLTPTVNREVVERTIKNKSEEEQQKIYRSEIGSLLTVPGKALKP
jgi:hypothetical protein